MTVFTIIAIRVIRFESNLLFDILSAFDCVLIFATFGARYAYLQIPFPVWLYDFSWDCHHDGVRPS